MGGQIDTENTRYLRYLQFSNNIDTLSSILVIHDTTILCILFAVLKIVFESVQQKHQDKTIFEQQIVNFVQKTNAVPIYGL